MEMRKGQKVKLSDLSDALAITIESEIEMRTGEADCTCFGIDEAEQLSDDRYFIFYNQTSSPDGEIQMHSAGRTTAFQIQLARLPPTIKKLVFTVTNDQDLPASAITHGVVRMKSGSQVLAECQFTGSEFQHEKAIILIQLYLRDGLWRITSVMSGFNGGLGALLAHYGGEELSPQEPAPKEPEPVKGLQEPAAPTVPAPVIKTAVSLKKPGDSHKVSLKKGGNNRLHVNLNWNRGKGGFFGNASKDLDLACLYILKDGRRGIVQALGNQFGNEALSPFIRLDHDDRSGNSSNGENMFFARPETVELAVVFAYIYEGASNWTSTDARIVIYQDGSPDIEIFMDNSRNNQRFCVIAVMRSTGGTLEIKREERYFRGHREIDQYYGFGLQWRTGRK